VTFTGFIHREVVMQISTLAEHKPLELKKHVGLIHSTNKLTLLERKIANALLFNAYENLLTQNEHQIHIPSLCNLIGYNSKDYKTIKRSLMSLISTVLEWNLLDHYKPEEEGIWVASSMLADAKIEGPICTYSYSNRMRELCHYPEFYGRLNMRVLSQFRSSYGLALYENCIRYQNINQTPWFDLVTYRKLMGVEGNKYEIFRDLNKRVIKTAVVEVNNLSPIQIKPVFKKQGRTVVAIKFLIDKTVENEALSQVKDTETERTVGNRLIKDYGFTINKANQLINSYSEQYLLDKMALIELSPSYRAGRIKVLSKYLEKALIEDYQPPKSSQENLNILKTKREKEKITRNLHQEYMQKYLSYQNRELPNVFRNLSSKKRTVIEKDFDKYINSTLHYNIYSKYGLRNPLVEDRFGDFIRESYPDLLASLLTFEEFCNERDTWAMKK